MAYVAIARKWRPQKLDEIVGQLHITRTLANALAEGRVHHALLFTGARGVGKTTAARAMARALNCEKGPTADPCGVCPSCKDVLAGTSPDVIEIDGASNNSVDDVRELRDSVRYLPQRGRSKVYIVDEVHMLSKGAFNALLKTLEEPPPHVVFMFATTEPQKIPDTILSRVQRFDFKRIPVTAVVERLRLICQSEGLEIPDDALRLVARAGEGSMRDAQSLLDQVISFAGSKADAAKVAEVLGLVDRGLLYDMLGGIVQGEPARCLEAIDRVYSFGFDLGDFNAEMLEVLRNATLMVLSPSARKYIDAPAEELTQLETLAKGVSADVFVRAFEVLMDLHEQLARTTRPRLVMDLAVARLTDLRPAVPIDRLLDRLADMERRARQNGGGSGRKREARSSTDAEPEPAPSPAAVEAEGLQASDGPSLPAAQGSPRTGFDAFREALADAGPRLATWCEDSAFGSFVPPVLRVVFPSEFTRKQAEAAKDDPRLLDAMRAAFPGAQRIDIGLRRSEDHTPTAREHGVEAKRLKTEQMRAELLADPTVKRLTETLGATLERVTLEEPVRVIPTPQEDPV